MRGRAGEREKGSCSISRSAGQAVTAECHGASRCRSPSPAPTNPLPPLRLAPPPPCASPRGGEVLPFVADGEGDGDGGRGGGWAEAAYMATARGRGEGAWLPGSEDARYKRLLE